MTDITKCSGDGCPVKDLCYRFNAPGSTYQSYFMQVPFDHDKLECEHLWERDIVPLSPTERMLAFAAALEDHPMRNPENI